MSFYLLYRELRRCTLFFLLFNLHFKKKFLWLKVKAKYMSHFNEEKLINVLIKKHKCVSLEVHYSTITLNHIDPAVLHAMQFDWPFSYLWY